MSKFQIKASKLLTEIGAIASVIFVVIDRGTTAKLWIDSVFILLFMILYMVNEILEIAIEIRNRNKN